MPRRIGRFPFLVTGSVVVLWIGLVYHATRRAPVQLQVPQVQSASSTAADMSTAKVDGPPVGKPLLAQIRASIGSAAPDKRSLRAQAPVLWAPAEGAHAAIVAALGGRYGTYDPSLDAWCTPPDSGDDRWWCTAVMDITFVRSQPGRAAMVTLVTVGVTVEGELVGCHACGAALRLAVAVPTRSSGWRIDAVSDEVNGGEFGTPGDVRVVQLGPTVVGWAIEERAGGMGAFHTSLRLYAQRRTKVVSVLEADTGSDDIAAVTEEGNGSRFTTAVTQDLGPSDSGFYGLHAVQSQQEIKRGQWQRVEKGSYDMAFDRATYRYVDSE